MVNFKLNQGSDSLLGVLLMSAAMLLIPFVDGIAKFLTFTHSPLFVSWARYTVASMLVLPVAFLVHRKSLFPSSDLGGHFFRTILLVATMTLYFIAITRIELATAMAAYFIGPIVATLLAVFFFKENLNSRKILALILGFSGALIVLNPGGEVEPGILYALGSGVCFAIYLVVTRQVSKNNVPTKTLAFQYAVGSLLLTPQALWAWSVPQVSELLPFLVLGVLSALSHILAILALRYAEASLLAPLVYLELLGTLAVGYIFFGEIPQGTLWVGAGIITFSGLVLVRTSSRG